MRRSVRLLLALVVVGLLAALSGFGSRSQLAEIWPNADVSWVSSGAQSIVLDVWPNAS